MGSGAIFFSWAALPWMVCLAILFFLALFFKQKFKQPTLAYSSLQRLQEVKRQQGSSLHIWARRCQMIAALLLLAALLDPHRRIPFEEKQSPPIADDTTQEELRLPTEGIGIYLLLDNSSSMLQQVKREVSDASRVGQTRLQALKEITESFVVGDPESGLEGRPSDLVGLLSFSRAAQLRVPLTLDHDLLVDQLRTLEPVRSRAFDGTAIGYAIYKAVSLIQALRHFSETSGSNYHMYHSALILVTDGLHQPHPDDQSHPLRSMPPTEAAGAAKRAGIPLYIISIERAILFPNYKEYKQELQNAAEQTGGKFYVAGMHGTLEEVYRDIDRLEKRRLDRERVVDAEVRESAGESSSWKRWSWSPLFIRIALAFLLISFLIEHIFCRRVP